MSWETGTIYCYRCHGRYTPGQWCLVWQTATGTEPVKHRHIRDIPDDDCPGCAMKGWHLRPQLAPSPPRGVM